MRLIDEKKKISSNVFACFKRCYTLIRKIIKTLHDVQTL